MKRREFCVAVVAGLGAPSFAFADERSPKNVVITFPAPGPTAAELRAAVGRRFAGNYAPDVYGLSRHGFEPLQRAARRALNAPRLESGASTYVLVAPTDDFVYRVAGPNGAHGPQEFRAVYALGRAPLVLGAAPGLSVDTVDALRVLALRRAAAGSPLVCEVEDGVGAHLANRVARILGAPLMREIGPLPPHPQSLAENARTELFIAPLSPVLVARVREGRLRVLTALTDSELAVRATLETLGYPTTEGFPVLPSSGPLSALAYRPTLGAYVARSESEDTVHRLHAAFAEGFASAAARRERLLHTVEVAATPDAARGWYETERARLAALATNA